MAKKSVATQKFAGQVFALTGKLDSWQPKTLQQFLTTFGGKFAKSIDKKLTYLIIGKSRSKKLSAEEKKVQDLNQNQGTTITTLDEEQFTKLAQLTRDEFVELAKGGPAGGKILKWVTNTCYGLGMPDLQGADLRGVKLDGIDFEVDRLSNVNLRGASLRHCYVEFDNCQLEGVDLRDTSVEEMTNCQAAGIDLRKADIYTLRADHSDLTEANLEKMSCDIQGTGITAPRSQWTGTEAADSSVESSDFSKACMAQSNWMNSEFTDVNFTQVDWQKANLISTKFTRCDLTRAKLQDANLVDAVFDECKMDGANFTGAHVAGLKVENSDVSKVVGLDTEATKVATAAGPNLLELDKLAKKSNSLQTDVTIRQGKSEDTIYVYWSKGYTETISQEMLSEARQHPGAVIKADTITLRGSGMPVPRKQVEELVIKAWHEAFGLEPPTADAIKEQKQKSASKKEEYCDKMIETLREKDGVKKWNKNSDNLRTKGVKLTKVDLSDCNLKGIDMSNMEAKEANLQKANLEKAEAWGCKLAQANLQEARCKSGRFNYGSMTSADLSGADFTKADLSGTNLKKAICKGTNFTRADLDHTDLCGADLTDAILDQATLHEAKFDETTKFPANFTPTKEMKWQGKGQSPAFKAAAPPKPTGPMDVGAFMKRLEEHSDRAKLSKALSMLKADRFKLYAQVKDDHLAGIVKSQSDPDLVYSCKLAKDGTYGCCTQNLNICGGLRGSICKHLLVLIVGLTKAGELDPDKIDDWVMNSQGQKPVLDKDAMSETFLKYKGAEAGEIDWRPTETIPEDYYAL